MATYYAYFLDAENHITERRDIEADSPDDAVARARFWTNGQAIEVWAGPVLVETIKSSHKANRR